MMKSMMRQINQGMKWGHSTIVYLSFPVIHKVGKVGILVQLLMRINRKWIPVKTILMHSYIYIWHDGFENTSFGMQGSGLLLNYMPFSSFSRWGIL